MKRLLWGIVILALILMHVQSLESVRDAAGRACLARGRPRLAYRCFAAALRTRLMRSFREDVSDLHRAMLDATLAVLERAEEVSRGSQPPLSAEVMASLDEAWDQILRYTKDVSLPEFAPGERERFDGLAVELLDRLVRGKVMEEDLAAAAILQGRLLAFRVTAGRPKPTGPPPPVPVSRRLVDPTRLLPWLDELGIGKAARGDVVEELRAYVEAVIWVKPTSRTFPALADLYGAAAAAREARGEQGAGTERLRRLEEQARGLAAEGDWAGPKAGESGEDAQEGERVGEGSASAG